MKIRKHLVFVIVANLLLICFSFAGNLMDKVVSKDFNAVKKLLAAGADVNERDEQSGSTPLIIAASYRGYEDMVKLLLANGADPNIKEKVYGNTALIAGSGISKEMVVVLLEHGADVNIKNFKGTSAFTSAITGILRGRVKTDVAELLLNNGADVNESPTSGTNEGYTRLMMAARNNAPDLVRFLIKHKADLNAKAKDGSTALSMAKKKKNEKIVKLLVDLGAKE